MASHGHGFENVSAPGPLVAKQSLSIVALSFLYLYNIIMMTKIGICQTVDVCLPDRCLSTGLLLVYTGRMAKHRSMTIRHVYKRGRNMASISLQLAAKLTWLLSGYFVFVVALQREV